MNLELGLLRIIYFLTRKNHSPFYEDFEIEEIDLGEGLNWIVGLFVFKPIFIQCYVFVLVKKKKKGIFAVQFQIEKSEICTEVFFLSPKSSFYAIHRLHNVFCKVSKHVIECQANKSNVLLTFKECFFSYLKNQ